MFQSSLRNTVKLAYITPGSEDEILIYRRCLYCESGNKGLVLMKSFSRKEKITFLSLSEITHHVNNHTLRMVQMDWAPLVNYERTSDEPCQMVIPKDSLDIRILDTLASQLNFSYELRPPCDNLWGILTPSGNFTGTIGTIQREEADFTGTIAAFHYRLPVLEFTVPYITEPMVIVSLKPLHKLSNLALINPLSGYVWIGILAAWLITGIALWIVEKTFFNINKKKNLTFTDAIVKTLSVLLEEPPMLSPEVESSRIILLVWWLSSMVFIANYKSSLMSHLTIAPTPETLKNLDQMIKMHDELTWGYLPIYDGGYDWFRLHTDPVVKAIYDDMEILERDEQLERLLKGGHVFINYKFLITPTINYDYTTEDGFTPINIAVIPRFSNPIIAWSVRRGAPFKSLFDKHIQNMTEGGFMNQWVMEVQELDRIRHVKTNKEKYGGYQTKLPPELIAKYKLGKSAVQVLTLDHLQSVFYLLCIGYLVSIITFAFEFSIDRCEK